ncbi:MAG: hypothetical protein ABJC12_08310 [Saprospiraceae bacterium]
MGLSIFYSGTLRDVAHLSALIDEVTDICDDLQWPWHVFQTTVELPLKGISFYPPGSQEVYLTFLPDGRLAEPNALFNLYSMSYELPVAGKDITLNPIIQDAGPEAHMRLIHLLRHLSVTYFPNFELTDESEFWETGDEQKCRDWFSMFEVWMDNMSADLGKIDARGYEGGRSYYNRLQEALMSGKSMDDIISVMVNPYK